MQEPDTRPDAPENAPSPDRRSVLLGGSAALAASMGALALGVRASAPTPSGTTPPPPTAAGAPSREAALNKAGWLVVGRLPA
ncbi:MAG: hypothetical protein GC161_15830 [Planctomycetaceae bacterium]|nr:hypothetical protein [Planctomycetaceae bacterium]